MIKLLPLVYAAITLFGQSFQTVLLGKQFVTLYRLVTAPVMPSSISGKPDTELG